MSANAGSRKHPKPNIHLILQRAAQHATGDGAKKDEKKAARLYADALRQGSGLGAYNLATMYERGEGVKQSWPKAEQLYRKAEKLGSGDASITLGDFALRSGEPSAEIEALTHFALAALNRDIRGLYRVALTAHLSSTLTKEAVVEAILSACIKKGFKDARALLRSYHKQ
jgi:TPR repeat protein